MLAIGSDNVIRLDALQNATTSAYINDATVVFSIYRKLPQSGEMTAGQTQLTVETGEFVAADVGKRVIVYGAGPAGSELRALISSVTTATVVVLDTAATVTVSRAEVEMSLAGALDGACSYVAASNGRYEGTFADTDALQLHDRQKYIVETHADGGGLVGRWRTEERAGYRK